MCSYLCLVVELGRSTARAGKRNAKSPPGEVMGRTGGPSREYTHAALDAKGARRDDFGKC
jgi:hypothetical protein